MTIYIHNENIDENDKEIFKKHLSKKVMIKNYLSLFEYLLTSVTNKINADAVDMHSFELSCHHIPDENAKNNLLDNAFIFVSI